MGMVRTFPIFRNIFSTFILKCSSCFTSILPLHVGNSHGDFVSILPILLPILELLKVLSFVYHIRNDSKHRLFKKRIMLIAYFYPDMASSLVYSYVKHTAFLCKKATLEQLNPFKFVKVLFISFILSAHAKGCPKHQRRSTQIVKCVHQAYGMTKYFKIIDGMVKPGCSFQQAAVLNLIV